MDRVFGRLNMMNTYMVNDLMTWPKRWKRCVKLIALTHTCCTVNRNNTGVILWYPDTNMSIKIRIATKSRHMEGMYTCKPFVLLVL